MASGALLEVCHIAQALISRKVNWNYFRGLLRHFVLNTALHTSVVHDNMVFTTCPMWGSTPHQVCKYSHFEAPCPSFLQQSNWTDPPCHLIEDEYPSSFLYTQYLAQLLTTRRFKNSIFDYNAVRYFRFVIRIGVYCWTFLLKLSITTRPYLLPCFLTRDKSGNSFEFDIVVRCLIWLWLLVFDLLAARLAIHTGHLMRSTKTSIDHVLLKHPVICIKLFHCFQQLLRCHLLSGRPCIVSSP